MKRFVILLVLVGCSASTRRTVLGSYAGGALLTTMGSEMFLPQDRTHVAAECALVGTALVAAYFAIDKESLGYSGGYGSGGGASDTPAAAMMKPSATTMINGAGAYAGRTDEMGNSYDGTGAYAGRRDSNGNTYDGTGAYAGRTDESGNAYSATGAYAGRLDSNGNAYDGTGAYAGRVDDNGNLFDRTGAYAGHIDGACDEACKQAAAAKLR